MKNFWQKFALTCAWVFACSAFLGQAAADEPVTSHEQMVVAANPHAAEAGIRILREGGNAVDAAIAVQLVLSLVEPQSSGVGGGAFLLYHDDSGAAGEPLAVTAYSGRETAPAAAGPDMFSNADSFIGRMYGGVPVGVPGVMRMLELAHSEHGRLPWADLFEPAIELAENGFEISPRLYFLLDRAKRTARAESFRNYFFDADGNPYETGHLLVNKEYAETLRLLAAEGAEPMYTGELAKQIVDRVHHNAIGEGYMTLEDLAAYQPEELEALCSPYREWQVCGPQLPSSGGITMGQMLGLLERFDLGALRDDPVEAIHLFAEAGRLSFADRNLYLADPKFVDVPVEGLLDPAYIRQRSALIDPDKALGKVTAGRPLPAVASIYAPSPVSDLKSTSHFSIVDKYGGAVSMTTSVQGAFGSQLMVGGFILNDQLTDFATNPEENGRPVANRPEGGKHPLSSMTPSMVFDQQGRLRLLVGSPGGTRIISFVAQAIVEVLDWGKNIQDAVDAPHFLSRGDEIELEDGTDVVEYADALRALGHEVAIRGLNSGLHGIVIDYTDDGRIISGGVDPRREGVALGD